MEAATEPSPARLATDPERFADVNGLRLCYQELGDPHGEPMLLVMGLGAQLVHWHDGFCRLLTEAGYRVIRFDNRDAGRSDRVDAPVPGTLAMLLGRRRSAAYTLDDMADDAAALLDHLGIDAAHVVGASMGGMIAQVVALRHPRRVRSLGLIMTGSGKRVASVPRLRALGTLLARAPRDREQFADLVVRTFKVIGTRDGGMPTESVRELALAAWDRGHDPRGVARQLHAVTASGDRTRRLRSLRMPTVVVHGTSDPLVRPVGGRAIAKAIPNAELKLLEGMGHDMPPALWPEIAAALLANARRAPALAPGA